MESARHSRWLLPLMMGFLCLPLPCQGDPPTWGPTLKRRLGDLAERWWKARPPTRFEAWDLGVRQALAQEARDLGALPEGGLDEAVALLWKPVKRFGPRARGSGRLIISTPYGDAWFLQKGSGRNKGLVIGLHGGGEGAGSADEAAGRWIGRQSLGIYPQAIRLVHDAWNTVHGERFLLTLIEIAKAQFDIDPDRVTCMGFSMGGTGSWFMAGRHPDLLAGAAPCAGVLMASPQSQVATKEEVQAIQHGFVPNVRNLTMRYFIGLADRNCMPGTYLFVADLLADLRAEDPGGYDGIHFQAYPDLGHAFPPGEPGETIRFLEGQRRRARPAVLHWEYASSPFPRPDAEDRCERLPKRYFYWLKCEQPEDGQVVRAEIADNVITLDVRGTRDGVHGLTLLLDDRLVDPTKEVEVQWKGQIVYRGRPAPDLWTVLETLDAKLDRSLVFDRRIEL